MIPGDVVLGPIATSGLKGEADSRNEEQGD
jgi:hypothetical protein